MAIYEINDLEYHGWGGALARGSCYAYIRMFGCTLAWHWHSGWVHVHFSTHSGFEKSGGVLLWCPTLVRVKNLVNFLVCNA